MVEADKPRFDGAAFLASAGVGRRIIQLAPKDAFFRREIPRTRSSIFRRACQSHGCFCDREGSHYLRFFPPVTLWEKSRSRRLLGYVWQRPPPLPPAPRGSPAIRPR